MRPQATQFFAQACRLRPEDFQAPQHLGGCYTGLGRETDARKAYQHCVKAAQKQLELHPDDGRALYLGANALCALGESEEGLQWAERAQVMNPDEPLTLYNVACIYSIQGELDKAADCLERSIENGYAGKDWLENDADLNPLRDHPRYQALLKKL